MEFGQGRSQDEQSRVGQGVADWLVHGMTVAKLTWTPQVGLRFSNLGTTGGCRADISM